VVVFPPSAGSRPNVPPPSGGPGVVGGLLLAPRPSQTQAPDAAPTTSSPAEPSSAPAPGDLSPRADNGDAAAIDPASPPPDGAVLGLPREVSLAELFPAEAAMGATAPDAAGPAGATSSGPGDGAGADSGGGSNSRLPLVAGIIVTLATLFGGGGLLWWRNRDTAYWPA
jgi:hypothetical protein